MTTPAAFAPTDTVRGYQHDVRIGRAQVGGLAAVGTDSGGANSTPVPFGHFAGGSVLIPAGSSITSLTFLGAEAMNGGTFGAAYDNSTTTGGVAIAMTSLSTGIWYQLPAGIFAYDVLKMYGNAAGTVLLSLKG